MPYEEWVFGHPPQTTTFVRINGNRVIRVAIGRAGKPLEVFTKDVVSPMMLSSGTEMAADSNVRIIKEGDVHRDPNTEAPAPPPTLLKPGEKLPESAQGSRQMKPVYFPKDQQTPTLGKNPDDQQPASPPVAKQPPSAAGTPPSAAQQPASPPAGSSQPATPQDGSQSTPQAGSNPSH